MFAALSHLAIGFPRRVVIVGVLALAVSVILGAGVVERFSPADPFRVASAQSAQAELRFQDLAGSQPAPAAVLLVSVPSGVQSKAGLRRIRAVARVATRIPGVARVVDARDTERSSASRGRGWASGSESLASTDGRLALTLLYGDVGASPPEIARRTEQAFAGNAAVTIGGEGVMSNAIQAQVDADLVRAEAIAFPLLLIAAVLVFRGLVAALLPVAVGLLTVAGTLLALRLVNEVVPLSVFALNLSLALGLGLSIDYSLFVTSRFREELALGSGTPQAIERTLHTAGRTVLFSAVTVAAALASLLVFPQMFLYSMAVSGVITAAIGALVAVTVLPAMLVLLGPRVNAGAPARWRRSNEREAGSKFWGLLARHVMRRPATVAFVAATVLLVAGTPFLRVQFTGIDSQVLPKASPARAVEDTVRERFAFAAGNALSVVVAGVGSERRDELEGYARSLGALAGASGVTRPVLADGQSHWVFAIMADEPALSRRTLELVRAAREADAPGETLISGPSAYFVDQQAAIAERLPVFAVTLALTTLVILFLMTGSVVLPLKTLLMNALSISVAFGVLVWIFQDGRLESVLAFDSRGALESTQPLLLLALAFGLSTDYAVFLLTRIKEARDAGMTDEEAVVFGLGRTGRIVTAAAVMFCIAIGAFATSEIVFVKEIGVGAAVAVMVDATVVRGLLVPALMRLLGGSNWWAPPALARVHRRLGMTERPVPVATTPARPAASPPPARS